MTTNAMLKIENLHAGVDGQEILKGVDLEVAAGEVHALQDLAAADRGVEVLDLEKR